METKINCLKLLTDILSVRVSVLIMYLHTDNDPVTFRTVYYFFRR